MCSYLLGRCLATFNLLFALAGLCLIILAIMIKIYFWNISTTPIDINVALITLIIVGCLVFVILFYGYCGSINENTSKLKKYAAILSTILIIEVGLSVFITVRGSDFLLELEEMLRELFGKYYLEQKFRTVVDSLQKNLKCCGINNWKYWGYNIPDSCCPHPSPLWSPHKYVYASGCLDKLHDSLTASSSLAGFAIIVIAVPKLCWTIHRLRSLRLNGTSNTVRYY